METETHNDRLYEPKSYQIKGDLLLLKIARMVKRERPSRKLKLASAGPLSLLNINRQN